MYIIMGHSLQRLRFSHYYIHIQPMTLIKVQCIVLRGYKKHQNEKQSPSQSSLLWTIIILNKHDSGIKKGIPIDVSFRLFHYSNGLKYFVIFL